MSNAAIHRILAYNAGRLPGSLQLKYSKMATDAFHFFRGTAHLFYEDLAAAPPLPASPVVWVCGDLHPENFGSYKGADRQVYFDISDFDEGLLAPALWEVARAVAGIYVAYAALRLGGAGEAATDFVRTYAATLSSEQPQRIDTETARGVVKDLLGKVEGRKREKWIDKRTESTEEGLRFKTVAGKQQPVEDKEQRAALLSHLASHPVLRSQFRVEDVCFRLAGTGSLGLRRYLFLIERFEDNKPYLLDMKQTHPSCLRPYVQAPQPAWQSEAHRTVMAEDRLLAVDKDFLSTTVFEGLPYRLEEMQPSEDKVELADLQSEPEKIAGLLHDAAVLTASAQLRSAGRDGAAGAAAVVAFGEKKDWQAPLLAYAANYAGNVQADYEVFAAWQKAL